LSTRTIRFPDGSYRQVTLGPASRTPVPKSGAPEQASAKPKPSEVERLRRLAERGTPEQKARARKHLDVMGSVW
jgi:hypothetical protein